jgi:DDB1- and CUL4-associated factor 13
VGTTHAGNLDPVLHPFAKEREYTRALNAAKLDKVFAKPFVAALGGHQDGIACLRRHADQVNVFLSGDFSGEVRVWNAARRSTLYRLHAHTACVRGLCVTPSNDSFLSCSDDKTIKLWRLSPNEHQFVVDDDGDDDDDDDDGGGDRDDDDDDGRSARRKRKAAVTPATVVDGEEYAREASANDIAMTWTRTYPITDVDYQRSSDTFVSSGLAVDLWDRNRSAPLHSFTWGYDSHTATKFNPVERSLFASLSSDRSIVLYDTRAATPVRKCQLAMRSNALSWNPMEAFNFTVANEDHNLYTFDMRYLDKALVIHRGHVLSVLAVDYSPTGREIVSGSYDRTVRIFGSDKQRARTCYHTERMQRIFSVQFTADAQYVLTGSEDANVRLWKTDASAPLRVIGGREKRALAYRASLRRRFAHMPEVRKVERFNRLPKTITIPTKEEVIVRAAQKRKREVVLAHSKPLAKDDPKLKGKKLTVKEKAVNAVIE